MQRNPQGDISGKNPAIPIRSHLPYDNMPCGDMPCDIKNEAQEHHDVFNVHHDVFNVHHDVFDVLGTNFSYESHFVLLS